MKDRFKFRAVLKTDTHSIIAKPYYIFDNGYFVNIDDVQKPFEKKYPDDCFWEFLEEIEKQENCQEVSTDGEIIIFDSVDGLIQCTGLKDKNGKLIYEGDIVEAKQKPDREGWYCVYRGIVKYDNKNCQYVINSNQHKVLNENKLIKSALNTDTSFNWFDWLEVIGNIYENKDLLNGNW